MRRMMMLVALLAAVPAQAQVSIDRVPAIAQAIHDAERVNLGASSTRESRNVFWARVVGVIHFGHPVFNPTPDTSWCIKDGGGGRPQSDDVIVQCRSRQFWDCIPNAGADGYSFTCHGGEILPPVQNVYLPPRPAGAGSITPPPPPPPPAGINLQPVLAAIAALQVKLDAVAGLALDARDTAERARLEAASAAHDAREINAWRMEPLKPTVIPCLTGRVPKPWGGSTDVTFCPVP